MLNPAYTNKFKKDLALSKKRGKSIKKITSIMDNLIDEIPLKPKHKDHSLSGNYVDCRECHIEPDWLLIYRIDNDIITFLRTGTHSDLFK